MGTFFDWLRQIFAGTVDVASPSHAIPIESIRYNGDANLIIISLGGILIPFTKAPKVWLTTVADTNSMDAGIDIGMTCIMIAGADETEQMKLVSFIKVGDIAIYNVNEQYILHRVAEIGKDSQGQYFIFKGDNNYTKDAGKVRDNQVLWLMVGVIY